MSKITLLETPRIHDDLQASTLTPLAKSPKAVTACGTLSKMVRRVTRFKAEQLMRMVTMIKEEKRIMLNINYSCDGKILWLVVPDMYQRAFCVKNV